MRRSDSEVECYAKHWVILKIHPDGSEPSKRGTSSFIFGGLMDMVFDAGVGEEDEGEGVEFAVCSRLATRRSKSSSFLVTWSWLEASLEIASSIRSRLDRLESAMGGSKRKHQIC